MSETLYNSLPYCCKYPIDTANKDSVKLANNQTVEIQGTTYVIMKAQGEKHKILVYVMKQSSNPLILGTGYLIDNQITINFGNLSVSQKNAYVRCSKRVKFPPHSEMVLCGKLPSNIVYGYQGICDSTKQILSKGLIVCKALVTVSNQRTVPVKLLNASSEPITIPKGTIIAKFAQFTQEHDIKCVYSNEAVHHVQKVDLVENQDNIINDEFTEFMSNFDSYSELTDEQNDTLSKLLFDNKEVFVTKANPSLGLTDLVQHHIILKPDFKPLQQRPYRLPPHKREVLRHHLDELLKQGVICELDPYEDAPITSPIVLIEKRSKPTHKANRIPDDKAASLQQYRFVVDYRFLNSQSQKFKYNIPNLLELTESFTERVPNFITSIDLSSGFFQMKLAPDSSKYTAFNTCFGTFKFLRVPMGLHTSPNSFQLLMDKILRGLTFKSCLCYLDDVLICSETFTQHMSDLQEVFDRFRHAGLKLNPRKCSFAKSSIVFLGHEISKDGIRPPPDRVEALINYPAPRNVKELRRALGMFNWFRKFIPNYSIVCEPLTKLLRKHVKFIWSNEQELAFQKLKQLLLNSDILAFPRFDQPFYLAVDSSSHGIGYVLYQKHGSGSEEKNRVIRFGSKSLTSWQKSYGPTKLELLGVVTSIVENSSYLRGSYFVVECDHQSLRPLFQNKFKGAIYDRWLAVLQQYNFDISYKPASQMQAADALSRCKTSTNISDSVADEKESPDEDDPYFPYMEEETGHIKFIDTENPKPESLLQVNAIKSTEEIDSGYIADDECFYSYNGNDCISIRSDHQHVNSKIRDTEPMFIQFQHDTENASSFNDQNTAKIYAQFADVNVVTDSSSLLEKNTELIDLHVVSYCDSRNEKNDGIDSNSVTELSNIDENYLACFDPVKIDRNVQNVSNIDLLCFESEYFDTQNSTSGLLIDEHVDSTFHGPILVPKIVPESVFVADREGSNSCVKPPFYDDIDKSDKIGIDSNSNSHTKIESDKIVCAIDIQALIPNTNTKDSIEFNCENVKRLQREDDTLIPLINYLEKGVLPKLQQDVRKVMLTSPDFCLNEGILFHSRNTKSKRTQKMESFQLVIPQTLISKIIKIYHESSLAGHMGIQQTIDNLSEHFYFNRLPSIVSDFVRSCHECQERKMTKAHTKSGIISYKTPTQPFQVWQMDLFGPLPVTQSGNTYVFTAVDMFSKYLFTVPLPNSDSITVSQAIFQLICTFGVCDCIISDRGSEFISSCTREVCKMLSIVQDFTPSFIHHCLGLCERTHRTVAERLTPYFTKGVQWDKILHAITFSFNVSANATTKYSPYEVLYGFRPQFPLTISSLGITDFKSLSPDFHQYVSQLGDKLKVIRDEMWYS